MTASPSQKALAPPTMHQHRNILGLSYRLSGRGGQPVTWRWLLTLSSKGQRLASPAKRTCWALGFATLWTHRSCGAIEVENRMLWPFGECHCTCPHSTATVFRSTRPLQTKGGQVIEFFLSILPDSSPFFFFVFEAADISGGLHLIDRLNAACYWEYTV